MRKIPAFLAVLLVAMIFTQNAWAKTQFGTLDFDQTWGDGSMKGKIYYGVFDFAGQDDYTDFITTSDLEIEDPFVSIAEDEYLYVYQIFNNDPLTDISISSFSIFANDTAKIIDESAVMGSFGDSPDELSEEGIEPTSDSGYDAGSSSIVWDFGDTYIQKDEHSWFLMLKSTSPPIIGDFEIKGPSEEEIVSSFEVPGNIITNPEPATIALLGLGSLMLFRKRNPK